jgi:uncharacterized protein (TIGR01777 family)
MKVVICGGGGFIGQRLAQLLVDKGYDVVILDRNQSRVSSPKLQSYIVDLLNPKLFEKRWLLGVEAVINVSGKDVLTLWTEEYKKAIRESRITVNKNLINFISSLDHKPKTFISASASGYYGDKGEHEVDETGTSGKGFLADVCVAWENEARRAETVGMRSVQVRTAPVLDKKGGFLEKLMKSMNFGFTARFGSGQNWFPWVHMEDLIRIYEAAIIHENLSGPVNACSPEPVRFHEFLNHITQYRKAIVIPFPISLVRLFAKELADELTNSQKMVPAKLQKMKFQFVRGELNEALKDVFT